MEKIALKEMPALARRILRGLEGKPAAATILALRGELGAGKTTFVQTLARELGVHEAVQSPTYVLMKAYEVSHAQFSTLIHIDAYRLDTPGEFAALRPEKFLHNPRALVCIEWPEKVAGALPEPDVTICFSSGGAEVGERYIEVVAT